MEYNSHLWAVASKSTLDFVDRIQSRPLKLIEDDRVASFITCLGHRRNVSCKALLHNTILGNARPNSRNQYHRPRYSRGIRGIPDEAMRTLLRLYHTAQRITGKILSLPVLHKCYSQTCFLITLIFANLKQV